MARMIQCKKLGKEAPGLTVAPLPGAKGQYILDNISQEAWLQWQAHQTRMINERHLNLLDVETRKYLTDQMEKFFNNEEIDKADGYVPETKD